MKRFLFALLLPASLAFGGPLSFGIKGGVPFTDAFHSATSGNLSYVTSNHFWTVGPELDINLPLGLGIETGVMYRRVSFESTQQFSDTLVHSATNADTWEFPLLLKLKLAPGPLRPYISAGPTFRGITNIKQVVNFFNPASTPAPSQPGYRNRFNTGFTVAGGVQILHHISPEIRYTRWGWNTFQDTSGLLKANPDQLSFLVGITF
ncbi:MAG TPA: outer membrane beta-barrel protein [Bryobacteraceae bacterium]